MMLYRNRKMDGGPGKSGEKTTSHAGVVSRFFLSSVFLGLLIGLFEAARLWTTPRITPLLVPDVGWVIWFLAPLVDMAFFGLVGVGLGLLGRRTSHKEVFVAIEGAIALTFVYLSVRWFHLEIGLHRLNLDMELLVCLLVFAAGFVVTLVLLALFWHRLASFADCWLDKILKPLAWGLAGVTVTAAVGIEVFVIWPPTAGPAGPTAAPPPRGAPNIVFITLDTVRADHLSSYGYSRPTTPNIDRFARTGVLFENAIAPSSWTLASHASMFTGLLPQQHGADWAVPLTSGPSTLAEILRSRGYQTAGFVANLLYMQKGWGIAQGFHQYGDGSDSLRHNLVGTLLGNAVVQPVYERFDRFDYFDRVNAAELNARIFRWFRHRPMRPYFLFVNYFDTHDPYFPPRPYGHRFGEVTSPLAQKLLTFTKTGARSIDFTAQGKDALIAGYDDCLAYLDGQLGELLKFLHQSRNWQNTIVIITSDHGEEFGDHGSYEHGRNLYRGVLHVPLILAGPGIPKDVRISHLVGTRQLFSTVLDLAGHGRTPFSRTSLARFWNPDFKPAPSDDAVVSEMVPMVDISAQHSMVSLTTPEWQYIIHRDGRQELYNWLADPHEQVNLAGAPKEEATLARVRPHLVRLVSNATVPWHGPEYLQALDSIIKGPARLSLLHPRRLQPAVVGSPFRIGAAQAFFKSDESMPARPTKSDRELMQSLPYQ